MQTRAEPSLAIFGVLFAALAATALAAPQAGDPSTPPESLRRPKQAAIEGRLVKRADDRLGFQAKNGQDVKAIEPGAVVQFPDRSDNSPALPPPFQVSMGENGRLSGTLRSIEEKSIMLSVPWRQDPIRIARPGVQAIVQKAGEARVFLEEFAKLDPGRWTVEGDPVVEARENPSGPSKHRVRLPAKSTSITHRLNEPLNAARLDLEFEDNGEVIPGNRWSLDLSFRGPMGLSTLRVVLGWSEDSLAVETPNGPSLAVQRLARSAGRRQLTVRFGPDQTLITVDDKILASGKGRAGPLDSVRIQAQADAGKIKDGLNALIGEMRLVRYAEPPASIEVDPTQDDVRLVVGDQLYGTIREGDGERLTVDVIGRAVPIDWNEISGVYFRRTPVQAPPIDGPLVRLEFSPAAGPGEVSQGQTVDRLDGTVKEITGTHIRLATPLAGILDIPCSLLKRLTVLEPGRLLVLDVSSHHLGDNKSVTPPLLDPPLPEGGSLERMFGLDAVDDRPAFMVLDVLDVVGESAGSPFSHLVAKGELRANLSINGRHVDYLNRFVETTNETPERIRIPVPPGVLKTGTNTVLIELTGIANNPDWLDDLGILQIAVLFSDAVKPSGDAEKTPSTAKP